MKNPCILLSYCLNEWIPGTTFLPVIMVDRSPFYSVDLVCKVKQQPFHGRLQAQAAPSEPCVLPPSTEPGSLWALSVCWVNKLCVELGNLVRNARGSVLDGFKPVRLLSDCLRLGGLKRLILEVCQNSESQASAPEVLSQWVGARPGSVHFPGLFTWLWRVATLRSHWHSQWQLLLIPRKYLIY